MRAETSKQAENISSQLIRTITEGKRKEEIYGPTLSLQDVFSESANLEGMQQKTSRQSETGQGIEAQLEGKGKRKPKGGRKKLQLKEKRIVKLQAHVTLVEYEKLREQFMATGMRYLSDYLRLLILKGSTAGSIANKQDLIKQLDKIGSQISKIGNNINQIAKYANIQLKTDKIDQRTIDRFNKHMEDYLKEERKLVKAYRALARNKE